VNEIATVVAIFASSVIVLTGLVAVTRAIWHIAQDLRDNKAATTRNTTALEHLATQMDGRLTSIESRLSRIERNRLRRESQERLAREDEK
jgi:predicted thioesterase